MKQFHIEVYNHLRELGIRPHLKGYEFIKTAMNYLQEKPSAIYSMTKDLYTTVAKRHGTTATRVERGMRHALETCYSDFAVQKEVLGTNRELCNSEFLATLNEVIKIKMSIDTKKPSAPTESPKKETQDHCNTEVWTPVQILR